jgi:hypothetical protein
MKIEKITRTTYTLHIPIGDGITQEFNTEADAIAAAKLAEKPLYRFAVGHDDEPSTLWDTDSDAEEIKKDYESGALGCYFYTFEVSVDGGKNYEILDSLCGIGMYHNRRNEWHEYIKNMADVHGINVKDIEVIDL